MDRGLEREVRRFATRVRVGAFLGGFADGVAAGALAFAAVLLVLRIVGVPLSPAWWWIAPVLLAAAISGLWRAAHAGFGLRLSAQHLDRRLGLEGLLLAAREVDVGPWKRQLEQRLDRAAEVRPRPEGRRLLLRASVGLLVLLGVALLPEQVVPTRPRDPLGAEVLQELERGLDALAETQAVEAETVEELRRRLGEVRAGAEKDGVLSWSDVDTLEDRLRHERDLEAGRLAQAVEDLAGLAADARRDGSVSAEDAASALQSAHDAGLLDALPEELLAKMGLSTDGSSIDPSALPADPQALAQLAAALAQAAGDELSELAGLEGLEGLEGLDLADLDAKLRDALGEFVEGEPCALCDGTDEDCPG